MMSSQTVFCGQERLFFWIFSRFCWDKGYIAIFGLASFPVGRVM